MNDIQLARCPKCGTASRVGDRCCRECGALLSDDGRPAHSKTLSIVSLVLGLCGIGVGAIITGVIALVQKRPGRGIAWAGVIIGSVGTLFALLITLGAFGVFWFAASQPVAASNVFADSAWTTPSSNQIPRPGPGGDERAWILDAAERAEIDLGLMDREIELLRAELPDPDEWAAEHGGGEGPEWFVPVYYHMNQARAHINKLHALADSGDFEDADPLMEKLNDELAAAREELKSIRRGLP